MTGGGRYGTLRPVRRLLVLLGFLTIVVNAASAAVAIRRDLPYDLPVLDRQGDPTQVQHDFVFSLGTALTPPIWVLAVMLFGTVLASFSHGGGRFGALLLVLSCGLTFAWVIAQPYARNRMSQGNLEALETSLLVANLALCAMTVLLGLTVLLSRSRAPHYR